jgi:hypothetical protein
MLRLIAALAALATGAHADVKQPELDNWHIGKLVDAISDETMVELRNESLDLLSCRANHATLAIGCSKNELYMGIQHSCAVQRNTEIPVIFRVGKLAPFKLTARTVPSGSILIARGKDAEELAGTFGLDHTLAVRFYDALGASQTVTFKTRLLGAAFKESGMTCDYPHKGEF